MTTGLLRAGRFGSSPFNFEEPTHGRFRTPLTLVDVTLREGQQAAEVAFAPDDETRFAKALMDAGIAVVQAGYAGADDASIARIRSTCPDLRLMALLVGWSEDAEDALLSAKAAGADICSVLFRSADAHLEAIGYSREAALQRIGQLVARAREAGFGTVIYGPSFASQADPEYLFSSYALAVEAGADVVSFADSLGVMNPESTARIVGNIRHTVPTADVRLHMHDDYGLALANTLAGLAAGANWAEVSVLGLGERAGNCCLEELVLALEGLYAVETGVVSSRLTNLCQLVADITGISIPPMKPVVGSNTFANKLEIHLQAVARDPTLMEPYDPSLVGNERFIRLGRGTGPTGVRLRAQELGIPSDSVDIGRVVSAINSIATQNKRAVTDEEFVSLMREAT